MRITIPQARTLYGFALTGDGGPSDGVVRAAAEADEHTIVDSDAESEYDPQGDDPPVTAESIAALAETARLLNESVRTAGENAESANARAAAEITSQVNSLIESMQAQGLSTPSMRDGDDPPNDVRVYDRFDANWSEGDTPEERSQSLRANLELAMMVMGGTATLPNVRTITPPEDLLRAWEHHVFSDPRRVPWHVDEQGAPTRAMDTAESGFGADLIGTQFATELWSAARNRDSIVGRIREIPMLAPTTTIPIDGDLPEMLFVGEATSATATAYTTSKTASSSKSLSAKKFTIQQVWSGEMGEDSLIQFVPFLRDQLNESAALHTGSAMYNGDTTNAGTGNINLDDADPDDTKHYLAFDGIRHYWLVDTTGQGKDMGAAAIDPVEITRARGKLNGADDDVDNAIKSINWGMRAQDLLAIMDWSTYMELLELDVVKTVDQYGPQATVLTGELARTPGGIPIIAPSYATKTDTDGKAVDTEASNTRGQLTVFNPRGFLSGVRRETQLFFDRVQGTDQFRFELYTRRGFTRFGENVAAGIYNISVS